MKYGYIDLNTIFKEEVVIDRENGLVGYNSLVVGTIKPSPTNMEIDICLPEIKGMSFEDDKTDIMNLLSTRVKKDSVDKLFFLMTEGCYLYVGKVYGTKEICLTIPRFQLLEEL